MRAPTPSPDQCPLCGAPLWQHVPAPPTRSACVSLGYWRTEPKGKRGPITNPGTITLVLSDQPSYGALGHYLPSDGPGAPPVAQAWTDGARADHLRAMALEASLAGDVATGRVS